mmetsp:Transcript_9755/g.35740  ORF Transcript_9755/g.35740 Transcript_9755/m.35740 type:complete len:281 (+) Transcript_9755:4710-5552(+)
MVALELQPPFHFADLPWSETVTMDIQRKFPVTDIYLVQDHAGRRRRDRMSSGRGGRGWPMPHRRQRWCLRRRSRLVRWRTTWGAAVPQSLLIQCRLEADLCGCRIFSELSLLSPCCFLGIGLALPLGQDVPEPLRGWLRHSAPCSIGKLHEIHCRRMGNNVDDRPLARYGLQWAKTYFQFLNREGTLFLRPGPNAHASQLHAPRRELTRVLHRNVASKLSSERLRGRNQYPSLDLPSCSRLSRIQPAQHAEEEQDKRANTSCLLLRRHLLLAADNRDNRL